MIVLGERVRDCLTGYKGIVVARTEFLYASPQVKVQREEVGDNGMPCEGIWIEEAQVQSVTGMSHIPNHQEAEPK